MSFRGKILGGGIVLEKPSDLPDGTEVVIEPTDPSICTQTAEETPSAPQHSEPTTLGQRLMQFSGIVSSMRKDGSRNHDHYIYGTPKK